MPRNVSAVDRADVGRLEHAEILQLIPVEEVPLVALQGVQRAERTFQPLDELSRREESEIVRADRGQQLQSDVGGRGPHGDNGLGIELHVVRCEPMRGRIHELIEIAPVQARIPTSRFAVGR